MAKSILFAFGWAAVLVVCHHPDRVSAENVAALNGSTAQQVRQIKVKLPVALAA
ncbi:hypothetical protein [Burkholderia sp. WSM2230]|uniref:hypothetical protein n=1 Tax=Burkholderia sp. WSM2230 TaxID=944435 RepID=UPI0012EC5C9D|nr:hypothetical protein [Burkholderia sp. WSM2230]